MVPKTNMVPQDVVPLAVQQAAHWEVHLRFKVYLLSCKGCSVAVFFFLC
jgi:hypothetical protein